MVRSRRFVVGLAILSLLGLVVPGAAPELVSAQAPPDFAPGQVLVKFEPGAPGQAVADAHRQAGGQVESTIPGIDVDLVRVATGRETAAVAIYSNNKNVRFSELNGIYHAIWTSPPGDPQVGQQWQYNNTGQTGGTSDADIDACEAWNTTKGIILGIPVPIAILDTGINGTHEDLNGKVSKNKNFTDASTTDDFYGHGTHVAGSAAATTNNTYGVAGTCPDCSLYNYKVLNDSGSGQWDWIGKGITGAADDGAKVISMSLGGQFGSSTVQSAVDYAWNTKHVVVVAAAGNNGTKNASYPAYYTNAIAVAATDNQDAKASFSNYGSWVDVAAPGVNILSTAPTYSASIWSSGTNGYATINGTSMATPHVAGIAGLVWAAEVCGNTDNVCVRNRIQSNADQISGTGSDWVHGRVNACRAVGGTCNGTAPTPASISATGGNNQSATFNTAFSTALQATVKDASTAGVAGVSVTFSAPTSGASGQFSSGATATVTTNSNGVATAPTFTANGTAGPYAVTASVSGVATPASFNLTNTSAPSSPSQGTTVKINSLTSSTSTTGKGWKATVAIEVRDSNGQVVSGAFVNGTWSNGYSGSASCTTGSNSKCSVSTGRIAGSVPSVTFTVNGVSGTGLTYNASANVGSSINVSRPAGLTVRSQ